MATHTEYTSESGEPIWGIFGEFKDPSAIYHGAEIVRDAGVKKWDVHSPFPIHGMDEAMGLSGPKVGYLVAFGGMLGASGAMLMQWYMNAYDYKFIVADKPFFAWEQFLPVTFELGVLISAFFAIFGMLALNKLPMFYHPLFKKERFLRASDDGFFIAIEARDSTFNPEKSRELLERAGAFNIELVEE